MKNLLSIYAHDLVNMDIALGTLQWEPATEHPELLAPPVHAALMTLSPELAEKVGVAVIDPELSDTAAFCAQYQVGMHQAANCVVLEASRGDKSWFAACVILGSTRADVNGMARRTLDARKVSFAPMAEAVGLSGMEYGAITPIGLPSAWPILLDKAAADSEYVIIGSGIRASKLAISGNVLAALPQVLVLEGLARQSTSA